MKTDRRFWNIVRYMVWFTAIVVFIISIPLAAISIELFRLGIKITLLLLIAFTLLSFTIERCCCYFK